MEAFKYEVVGADGKSKTGMVEAATVEAARAELKAQGNTIIKLGKASALDKNIEIHIGKIVKPREMSVFCRQFESVLKAGVTVIEALGMLEEQTENKEFRKAIGGVRDSVQKGETLASAMMEYPKIFPDIMIYMIEAGEASGSLDIAFNRLSTHFEKDSHLRSIIIKAAIYPAILIVVIIAIIVVMMVWIIPSFLDSYDELDAELPGITKGVMAISDFFVNTWYILLIVVVAFVLFYRAFKKTEMGAMVLGRLALKMPLFGDLTVKSAASRFTSTLSTLMSAGIQMVDAVRIVRDIMGNAIVKQALQKAEEDITHGIPLSDPLEESGVFPPMVHHMIRIGEETGNMEGMMDKISEYYDEEVEDATETITSVLEPLIIIIMACIVVPLLLAIMLPMYTLYSSIE